MGFFRWLFNRDEIPALVSREYIEHRIYKITRDQGIDLHTIGNLIRFTDDLIRNVRLNYEGREASRALAAIKQADEVIGPLRQQIRLLEEQLRLKS